MKNLVRKLITSITIIGAIIFPTNFIFAAENNQPIIKTKSSPSGSSVTVVFPEGFSGRVMTTCYNGVCTSTSSPVTETEIKETIKRIDKHRRDMEEFFKQQQELLDNLLKDNWVWNFW